MNGAHHDQYEELLDAYVLDAVEDDERALVEEHLATCVTCSREVASLREVAALLGASGAEAPAGVWDRIAGELDEPPPPLRLFDDGPGAGEPGRRTLTARRDRRRARSWVAVAIGSVAAVAAVAIGVIALGDSGGSTNPPVAVAMAGDVAAARAEPGTTEAKLSTTDGVVVADLVLRANGRGYMVAQGNGLPALDGRIYQLWGKYGGDIVSLGTMGSLPDPIEPVNAEPGALAIMVSVEQQPVPQPQGDVVAQGTFA